MKRSWALSMAVLFTVILSSQSIAHAGHFEEDTPPKIYDVQTFDVTCALSNASCSANETTHLIEYFSADWCEPCVLVSEQIASLNRTDTTILQHHPSPSDLHFFPDSNIRLYETYGFWGIPDVVLSGEGLLVGSSQSNVLTSTLDNFTRQWSGFVELTLTNGTLSWEANDGHVVHVWITKNRPHEYSQIDQEFVVTNHVQFNVTGNTENNTASNGSNQSEALNHTYINSINISNLLGDDVTSIVVTLETPGRIPLSYASSLASLGYDLIDENPNNLFIPESTYNGEPDVAIAVFGLTLAAIVPALIIYVQTVRKQSAADYESE